MTLSSLAGLVLALAAAPGHSPSTVGGDSSAVRFARARDLARTGDPALAMRTYLAGAEAATTAADWERYRKDLGWIWTPKELTVWQESAPSARRERIAAWFSERDVRDSLPAGGRFAEHVRRLDHVFATYRIAPKHGKVPVIRTAVVQEGGAFGLTVGSGSFLRDYIPTQGEIDDRGALYVRHGAPEARTFSGGGQYEIWSYRRDGGPYVVYFAETLFDGASGNTTLVAVPEGAPRFETCGIDGLSCASGGSARRELLRQRSLKAIRTLMSTESAGVH